MPAAGILGALGAMGGSLMGAVSHQGRSPAAAAQKIPRTDTSTAAIAGAKDPRTARMARSNADAERVLALLTDDQLLGLLVVFGGLWAAQKIPWSDNATTNAALTGAASTAAVLMGLGRAGVGDLTTLMLATGAGVGSVSGQISGAISAAAGAVPHSSEVPMWQNMIPGGPLISFLK
jgi:hypothetical protein